MYANLMLIFFVDKHDCTRENVIIHALDKIKI